MRDVDISGDGANGSVDAVAGLVAGFRFGEPDTQQVSFVLWLLSTLLIACWLCEEKGGCLELLCSRLLPAGECQCLVFVSEKPSQCLEVPLALRSAFPSQSELTDANSVCHSSMCRQRVGALRARSLSLVASVAQKQAASRGPSSHRACCPASYGSQEKALKFFLGRSSSANADDHIAI